MPRTLMVKRGRGLVDSPDRSDVKRNDTKLQADVGPNCQHESLKCPKERFQNDLRQSASLKQRENDSSGMSNKSTDLKTETTGMLSKDLCENSLTSTDVCENSLPSTDLCENGLHYQMEHMIGVDSMNAFKQRISPKRKILGHLDNLPRFLNSSIAHDVTERPVPKVKEIKKLSLNFHYSDCETQSGLDIAYNENKQVLNGPKHAPISVDVERSHSPNQGPFTCLSGLENRPPVTQNTSKIKNTIFGFRKENIIDSNRLCSDAGNTPTIYPSHTTKTPKKNLAVSFQKDIYLNDVINLCTGKKESSTQKISSAKVVQSSSSKHTSGHYNNIADNLSCYDDRKGLLLKNILVPVIKHSEENDQGKRVFENEKRMACGLRVDRDRVDVPTKLESNQLYRPGKALSHISHMHVRVAPSNKALADDMVPSNLNENCTPQIIVQPIFSENSPPYLQVKTVSRCSEAKTQPKPKPVFENIHTKKSILRNNSSLNIHVLSRRDDNLYPTFEHLDDGTAPLNLKMKPILMSSEPLCPQVQHVTSSTSASNLQVKPVTSSTSKLKVKPASRSIRTMTSPVQPVTSKSDLLKMHVKPAQGHREPLNLQVKPFTHNLEPLNLQVKHIFSLTEVKEKSPEALSRLALSKGRSSVHNGFPETKQQRMDWKEEQPSASPHVYSHEAFTTAFTQGRTPDKGKTTVAAPPEDSDRPVYLDLDNPSVQVDVEGLCSDDEEIDVSDVRPDNSGLATHVSLVSTDDSLATHVSHVSTDDSGIVLDLSKSGEFTNTPKFNRNKPLETSTPLWRPWHQTDNKRSQDSLVIEQTRLSVGHHQQQAHTSQEWINQQAGFQRPLDVIIPYGYPYHIFDPRFFRSPVPLSAVISPMAQQFTMMPAHSPQSTLMTQHATMMAHQPVVMTSQTAMTNSKSAMMSQSPMSKSSMLSHPVPMTSQPAQMSPADLMNAQQNMRTYPAQMIHQCQVPQITTTQPTKPSVTNADENRSAKRRRVTVTPRRQMSTEVKKEPLVECSSNLHRVVLSSPPADALPARLATKGKRKAAKAEVKSTRKDAEKTKRRDKPPLYGDHELHELHVVFEDMPLKYKFCDESGKFVVPMVPDNRDEQVELRQELLDLFHHSNLPPVPNSLRYSVHALCHYPHMHHLFSLYQDGVDLETLQFGAYGQAFGNIKLAELGEEALNKILDQMSYVGADGLMHCLVRRAIDNGVVCDHVATELGKMRRHSKNHYPEKKWVCCFCRAQMPDMTDMERHTSTHTGLKPFRCVECNKFFSQKVTLEHHMISVHNLELEKMDPKKTFTCRQDGCLFLEHEREACLLHLAQHHDEDDFKNRRKRKQWPYDS